VNDRGRWVSIDRRLMRYASSAGWLHLLRLIRDTPGDEGVERERVGDLTGGGRVQVCDDETIGEKCGGDAGGVSGVFAW
jgi:hypothetical protein